MSKHTPDHPAVWVEIPVTDMDRSRKFYEAVTTMELKEDNTGPNPMAVFQSKDPAAGVSGHLYPGKPAADGGNTIHLSVPKPLESVLERVKQNGGTVESDIMTIPPGQFAYCKDPDGNSVGFFVYN